MSRFSFSGICERASERASENARTLARRSIKRRDDNIARCDRNHADLPRARDKVPQRALTPVTGNSARVHNAAPNPRRSIPLVPRRNRRASRSSRKDAKSAERAAAVHRRHRGDPGRDTDVSAHSPRGRSAACTRARACARVRLTRAVYHIDWLPRSMVASAPVNG